MYKMFSKKGLAMGAGLGLFILAIYILASIIEGVGGYTMFEQEKGSFFTFVWGIGMAQLLCVAAVLAAIGFGVYQLILNPASGLKILIGFAVLLVVFLLSMLVFGGESSANVKELLEDFDISSSSNKLINGIVGTGLILSIVSILAAIGLELYAKYFRKS